MPEEIKITPYASKDYKSDYILSTDDSQQDADHSDREMSRSESSSCSDESGCYKQNGLETVEIIPTRTTKTSVPKPAANPLQFVKIGPCDLYRSAQKQIQKVSDVKKPAIKEITDEMEDWQSNLDNWKCNRRKQQEHIIERVVEVKKLELYELDRNRKKTKTFSEMMEERTSKGRKLSVPLYLEEESDDLSNLGINSIREKNETEPVVEEEIDEEDFGHGAMKSNSGENSACNGVDEVDHTSTTRELTYESAIQNYETRMKSVTNGSSVVSSTYEQIRKSTTSTTTTTSSTTSTTSPLRKYGRMSSATKIEEKLSELERIKNRSMSSTDLTEKNKKSINIPRVNIFKRKEMFEKVCETNGENKSRRSNGELSAVRSIKERLSSLEKTIEGTSCKTKNVPVSGVPVKNRLSLINKKISEEKVNVISEKSVCRERRLSSAKCKPNEEMMNGSSKGEDESVAAGGSSGRSSSSEDYEHMHSQVNHFHHRSLDSLQGHDSANDFCFERVQSLECIDCCSNYPASVLSGDTDREDSGIHTADVSSSVSQADDFDMHADTSMDGDLKSHNAAALINEDDLKADKSSHSGFCIEEVRQRIDIMEQNLLDDGANENVLADTGGIETTTMQCCGDDSKRMEPVSGNENQNVAAVIGTEKDSRMNDCCLIGDSHNDVDGVQEKELFVNEEVSLIRRDDPLNEQVIKTKRKGEDNPELKNQHDGAKVHQNSNEVGEFTVINQNYEYINLLNNQIKDNQLNDLARSDSMFAFEPSIMSAEPPKEKPPPPPFLENSDDELEKSENVNLLRRIDSTKRIKKEIRLKRSSFLGIEGYDDSYLTPDLEAVKPPPDMTSFLEEERRLEKMLFRQSICSESDSMQAESQDSGVELDKNHNDENSWPIERADSMQDSETYAYMSMTSEEDEIIKKEKEILEILELEEQRNYENDIKNECVSNVGEKLVSKLKELERQKNGPSEEHENEQPYLDNQPKTLFPQIYSNYEESFLHPIPHPMHQSVRQSADSKLFHQQRSECSLLDITDKNVSSSRAECTQLKTRLDYRNSMPDIQQEIQNPLQHCCKQSFLIPSKTPSDCSKSNLVNKLSSPQQMSKQTLQALSAVPRSKIVATDSWVQSRKKPRQEAYNHKHWLIQEAEHRRLIEYRQRQGKEALNIHNYVNVHQESAESKGVLEGNDGAPYLATSPHSSTMYAHSQMLPVSKQNQNCNLYEHKNTNKSHYISSSISSNCNTNNSCSNKPLPDSVIQTLTQRVQNRFTINDSSKQRRCDSHPNSNSQQEKMLSVSGKKKCSHCGNELGRGAAMIIESLRLFYHIDCFRCCVCCVQLGDGLIGTDVRVRNSKLHCHSCYSNDEGLKFSCV